MIENLDEYENRFRDPAFVAIWDRWQKARGRWRAAREHDVPFHEGGHDLFYDPVPSLLTRPDHRDAAQEFQDARAAYKAKLASYSTVDPSAQPLPETKDP